MQPDLDVFWPSAALQFLGAAAFEEFRTSWPTLGGTAFGGIGGEGDNPNGETFFAKGDRIPGDLGFDPLKLKPKKEKDLLAMQNREILNARLAMIAAWGIMAQELVTGEKVFR